METQGQMPVHQGLEWSHWFTQADGVVQGLACVLLLMSIATWTIVIVCWRQWRLMQSNEVYKVTGFDKGLSLLGAIASLAPFVGLLGTVWGIMQTLLALGASSQLNFQMIAAPLGEALLMTAVGLFVAIPASAGHRWLMHLNEQRRQSALQVLQNRFGLTQQAGEVSQ